MKIHDKEYKELLEFRSFLKGAYINALFDAFDIRDADLSEFDITIKVMNREITIPTNADLYDRLTKLIDKEIEEY